MKTKVKKQVEVKTRTGIDLDTFTGIDIDTLMFHLWEIKGTTFAQMKTRTEPKMRKTNNPYLKMGVIKESDINVLLGGSYENNVNSARIRESVNNAREAGLDKDTLNAVLALFKTNIEYKVEQWYGEKGKTVPERGTKEWDKMYREWEKSIAEGLTPKFEAKTHKWAQHSVNPFTNETSRIVVEKRSDPSCKYIQVWILDTKNPVYRWKDTNEVIDNETLADVMTFIQKSGSNKEYQGLEKEIIIRDYAIQNIKEITLNKVHYYIK